MSARRRRKLLLPFLAVPLFVLRSAVFRALSPPATKLLLAVGAEFRGDNNGELEAPFGELMRDWHYRSRHTISRAIAELLNSGLMVCTRKGRCFGKPEPSLYALAWYPIPASEQHGMREIAARFTPQIQNASAPRAPVKPKQVQLEHLQGKKCPISAKPKNEVMRVSQVHCGSDQVLPEHYLSRYMPHGDELCARALLEAIASISDDTIARECKLVASKSSGQFCTPLGGSPITKSQLAYLKFQNRVAVAA